MFGDAAAVASSKPLLEQFLCLPHAAVLALLQDETLVTDAEATVLLLLSEWCNGEQGKACTEAELQQLNGCIRYGSLSTPYLTELCTHLHTPSLAMEERMELVFYQTLCAESQTVGLKLHWFKNPGGWYLPRRPTPLSCSDAGTVAKMTLKVTQADLLKFLRAAKLKKSGSREVLDTSANPLEFISEPLYSHGFWWTLDLSATGGIPWCGLLAHGVASLQASCDDNTLLNSHGVSCRFKVSIVANPGLLHYKSTYHEPVNSSGIGCIFDEENNVDALNAKWWQPHMVDGCITLEARILEISP